MKNKFNKIFSIIFMLVFALSLSVMGGVSLANADITTPEKSTIGNIEELSFMIDTGTYISGISSTTYPEITLILDGAQANASATTFWYREQAQIGSADIIEVWKQVVDDNTADNQAILYLSEVIDQNVNLYQKYLFFKTVIAKSEETGGVPITYYEEYINPSFVDMIVDKTASANIGIANISTFYNVGGAYQSYNTENPNWVSTDIKFQITSLDSTIDNVVFYYSLGEGAEPIAATTIQDGSKYYGVATISKTFQGVVSFSVSNKDSSVTAYGGRKQIKLDTASPVFSVTATKDNGSQPYGQGEWSSTNVEYNIVPSSNSECISGATYYYANGEVSEGQEVWHAMGRASEDKPYKLSISQTTQSIKFKSVSNAGKEYVNADDSFSAQIDKVKPNANLLANDAKGKRITSMDADLIANARKGYASDSIIFNLTNSTVGGSPIIQNAPVFYEYKIGHDGEYKSIVNNNGSYSLTASFPVLDKTYYFRIRTAAGLSSEVAFKFSVLDSKFTFTMDELKINSNADGWAKDKIAVYLNVPRFLGNAKEYIFYSEIQGDNLSKKLLTAEFVSTTNGIDKFRVYIDESLNNQKMLFYAQNLANDDATPISTSTIKLDLKDPIIGLQKFVYGSSIALSENDWANGKVNIVLTPDNNISGIVCYPIIGTHRGNQISINSSNQFLIEVSATGIYRYEIVTGAGRSTFIDVTVNIDTSDITGVNLKASNDDNDNITTDDVVSKNVKIEFENSHNQHFRYYYQQYSGGQPDADFGRYTLGTGLFYMIEFPTSSKGTVKYAFIIESLAVDKDGVRKRSAPTTIFINYNLVDFAINIVVDNYNGGWTSSTTGISFGITSDNAVDIAKYQIQLDGESTWRDIIVDASSNAYAFKGIEQFYSNPALKLKDASIGFAYNGKIKFRALSKGGHSSAIVIPELTFSIDLTTPDARYMIDITAGELITSSSQFLIYSKDSVYATPTKDNINKPVFKSMSPIKYYYYNGTADSQIQPTFSPTDYKEITAKTIMIGNKWIYALNEVGKDSYKYIQFITNNEEIKLNASFQISAGAINGGIFEYSWSDKATVNLTSVSSIPVYYWYSYDNIKWMPYFTGDTHNSESAGKKQMAFTSDCNSTVSFKITNLAGKEAVATERAIIKIDKDMPSFNIIATLKGNVIENPGTSWQNGDVNITIEQRSNSIGGINYQYRLSDNDNWSKLNTTFFSTNDLVNYEGNGVLKLTILATSESNSTKTNSQTITLKIDKVMPTFKLKGSITPAGTTESIDINSGEWSKSKEIILTKAKTAENKSLVTYQWYWNNDTSKMEPWHDTTAVQTLKEIGLITVIATTESGLIYTASFQANIDHILPTINADGIAQSEDPANPSRNYIDQVITYEEANVKSATFNGFNLENGQTLSPNNVDSSNGGLVTIRIEDKAGNVATLVFYMCPFDYNINTITLSEAHINALDSYEQSYLNKKAKLPQSRQIYFETDISRLRDRLTTLEKQIAAYRTFLDKINDRVSFDLKSDYPSMKEYINFFETTDSSLRYPEWQQEKIKEGIYNSYYNKLKSEYAKLDVQMQIVKTTERSTAALPAINVVKASDYTEIMRVYNAYDSMTIDQKATFTPTLFTKLTELKRRAEVLRLQDATTGIEITGDNLYPGLKIEIFTYARTTEQYNKVQMSLLEVVPKGSPRAIISINALSLSGEGSQNSTGDIIIRLPIPDEYFSYIQFAVYRLSPNGTISPVTTITRAGDGKSVTFESTSVDTFILAAEANITVRPPDSTIYGVIGGIEIDAKMLKYITIAVSSMFVIVIIFIVIAGFRRRKFLATYNKKHRRALQRRGIKAVPKGNPDPRANPLDPSERLKTTSYPHKADTKKQK